VAFKYWEKRTDEFLELKNLTTVLMNKTGDKKVY
jgi:hypothetical protein